MFLSFLPLDAATISLIAYESHYSRLSDDAGSLDIAYTTVSVSVPVKSPQDVPGTSIKLVRETHTPLLESLTPRCRSRGVTVAGLYRATRYTIRRTCTRNRSDIAQPTTHAYSNESRWFSSHALEDSCYTHRDFARLMHSCTYPSRDSESVNTAGHGAATQHYWNHRVFPPSCRRSLYFIFFPQLFIILLFFRTITTRFARRCASSKIFNLADRSALPGN